MKSTQTQESGSDIRVQISMAPTRRLRVIQMQSAEMLQTHDVVEFPHEGLEACGGDEVVAGGVAVAGVDADADAGMVFRGDLGDNVAEFG